MCERKPAWAHGLASTVMDDCEDVQKKTFCRWINWRLRGVGGVAPVTDLLYDLRDGLVLLALIEALTGHAIRRERGALRVHRLSNVTTLLNALRQEGVRVVGVSNADIVDGSAKATLTLLWAVVFHFQLQKVVGAESALLAWCRRVTANHGGDAAPVNDLRESWRDGVALVTLVHRYAADKFDLERTLREKRDPLDRLEFAFALALEVWQVPRILDPADVAIATSDKKSVMTYLGCLYQALPHSDDKGQDGLSQMASESGTSKNSKQLFMHDTS